MKTPSRDQPRRRTRRSIYERHCNINLDTIKGTRESRRYTTHVPGTMWEMRSLGMNESGSAYGSRLFSVGVLGVGYDWDLRLPLAVTW